MEERLAEIANTGTEKNTGGKGFAWALALLAVAHLAGFLSIHWQWPDVLLASITPFGSFMSLTPFNLLLTTGVLLAFHRGWTPAFFLFCAVAALGGFFAEVLGVQTGLLFGEYTYGKVLGPKLWGTPFMIGVNWLMLLYCSCSLSDRLAGGIWAKAGLAALLMVALDGFIEPVAIALGFWTWTGGQVPAMNYVGWFAVSYLLAYIAFWLPFRKKNPMALPVLGLQWLFFLANNLAFSFS